MRTGAAEGGKKNVAKPVARKGRKKAHGKMWGRRE